MEELLTIVECFEITGRGVVLVPDFEPPKEGKWRNLSRTVMIVKPAGERLELQARFELNHFNIRDPSVDPRKRWRICITLPAGTKDLVGSKLLCDPEVKRALSGGV
jgi:hypothetical protein